ncbi:MAG TPA: MmgE/PrpD family protein [Candidatus Acidoferrales bacterium]|nr:MmgE/PrpD family protein [Candidatus Acidoferrales bacterium]
MTSSGQLAEFAFGLRLAAIPGEVIEVAKWHVLDTLGVALAGKETEASRAVWGVVQEFGGKGESTVWGSRVRLPSASAAMINGTYAHALDFDDSHLLSVIHPSATLVPALLAQAEADGADGAEFLVGLVAAYEIILRLGIAQVDPELGNSVFFERGAHATSILGTVAAAVGCARTRGLSPAQLSHALAIACSMGAGILEANRSGGSVKQAHCGWAAHAAVLAASFASHGLTGPASVLEGRFGLFQNFCGDRWNEAALTEGLGSTWLTSELALKPYPCNMFTHCIVDAAIALKQRGVGPNDVAEVTIHTAAAPWRTIGDPIEDKRRPRTPYHAAFSAPFVFACALVGGGGLGLALSDFTETMFLDPVRRRLAEKCSVVIDEGCTAVFPRHAAAIVEVVTHEGRRIEEKVMVNRGSPERPLSRDEVMLKLRSTAGGKAGGLVAAVADLETKGSVSGVIEACV